MAAGIDHRFGGGMPGVARRRRSLRRSGQRTHRSTDDTFMITDAVTPAEPGAVVVPSAATAGRDLLGELPLAEQLVSFVAPGSFAADQYRSLRHIVEQMRKESDVRVLAVTSPTPGDGKTLTTLNLAGALAQAAGARVLVIDADLRRPSITGYLPCGRG